jgi:hypothetical protein
MEYVGWQDIKSAMRYLEVSHAGLRDRFENGLRTVPLSDSSSAKTTKPAGINSAIAGPVAAATALTTLRVTLSLSLFSKGLGSVKRALRLIEKTCLERHTMYRLKASESVYELQISSASKQELDDTIYAMLDEMVQVAQANYCHLEVSVYEPATKRYWN